MSSDDFRRIVNTSVCEVLQNYKSQKCDDQAFGVISNFANNSFDRRSVAELQDGGRKLIMILESPHKDEFPEEEAPIPANGTTGENIKRYLLEVEGLSEYADSKLIVMNAIQYQCSLGCDTKRYRDEIFRACWNRGGKEDFISRLREAYRNNDVILNCCTKGDSEGDDLRDMVCLALRESFPDATILGRTHPSSWHRRENRNFTYVC